MQLRFALGTRCDGVMTTVKQRMLHAQDVCFECLMLQWTAFQRETEFAACTFAQLMQIERLTEAEIAYTANPACQQSCHKRI